MQSIQCFLQACKVGDVQKVNHILSESLDDEAEKTPYFCQGLVLAATFGHLPIVNCLLNFSEVSSQANANYNAALRGAAAYNRLDVAARLLCLPSVRAQINITPPGGKNALVCAFESGHIGMVDLLQSYQVTLPDYCFASSSASSYLVAADLNNRQDKRKDAQFEQPAFKKRIDTQPSHITEPEIIFQAKKRK